MNPVHFESDPADIRINLEIRLQIPDQIMALSEFALSGCSCLSLQLCVSMVACNPATWCLDAAAVFWLVAWYSDRTLVFDPKTLGKSIFI